ncbi:hypothetical protein Tcan_18890 [Toxocara canis]|uniref:Uncharacterized protein n=1 Tax=Toxocara canis TaxID=6265 RepID=A0A0B2VCV3_TOXCA|nr:hypothetical protein Tcan_18890 [Toxocara canis]
MFHSFETSNILYANSERNISGGGNECLLIGSALMQPSPAYSENLAGHALLATSELHTLQQETQPQYFWTALTPLPSTWSTIIPAVPQFEENGVTYYGEAAIAKQMQHYSAISEPDNLIQCSANEIQQRSMHFDVNSPMSLTSFDGPVAISAEAPLQASLVPREEPNMEWNRTSDMWMGPPPTFQQPADQQTTVIPVVSPPFTVFPGLQFLTSSNGFPARTRSFTHTFQQKPQNGQRKRCIRLRSKPIVLLRYNLKKYERSNSADHDDAEWQRRISTEEAHGITTDQRETTKGNTIDKEPSFPGTLKSKTTQPQVYTSQRIRYHGQRFSPCQFLTVEASTYGEPPLLTPTGIPAQQLDRDSLDGYVGTIAK